MPGSEETPFSFVFGYILDNETFIVIAQLDDLIELGEPDSEIMKWNRKDKSWASFDVEWTATRICRSNNSSDEIFAAGPEGRVLVKNNNGVNEEWIDYSDEGTKLHGDIRDLRFIGKHIYAAGMGRQVYRREGNNNWVRWDTECLQEPSLKNVYGFNSIHGKNGNDIYAVGFSGEIWNCKNNKWRQIDSPTNVILNRVLVVNKSKIFAAGQSGVLLCGKQDVWEVVEHDVTDSQIWDLEWFDGKLYVSTDDAVYFLNKNDLLSPVDMKLGEDVTCGNLHANDGLLISIGEKHVCWTKDGKEWHDITP